jgi:hypothetical protein
MYLGFAEFCRDRVDAAIEQFKRAVYSGYPTYIAYAVLAGAEAAKGNDAEAKRALTEARRHFPQLTQSAGWKPCSDAANNRLHTSNRPSP